MRNHTVASWEEETYGNIPKGQIILIIVDHAVDAPRNAEVGSTESTATSRTPRLTPEATATATSSLESAPSSQTRLQHPSSRATRPANPPSDSGKKRHWVQHCRDHRLTVCSSWTWLCVCCHPLAGQDWPLLQHKCHTTRMENPLRVCASPSRVGSARSQSTSLRTRIVDQYGHSNRGWTRVLPRLS